MSRKRAERQTKNGGVADGEEVGGKRMPKGSAMQTYLGEGVTEKKTKRLETRSMPGNKFRKHGLTNIKSARTSRVYLAVKDNLFF